MKEFKDYSKQKELKIIKLPNQKEKKTKWMIYKN